MKTTASFFVCAAVLGIAVTSGLAQGITIDTTDVKAMFAVGTTTVYRIDTLTTRVNIGGPGQSSWDFSPSVSRKCSTTELTAQPSVEDP